MKGTDTVTINGQHYDAKTGMRVDPPKAAASSHASKQQAHRPGVDGMVARSKTSVTHAHVHRQTERSQTLNRHGVKKPIVAKSPVIQKFAAPSPSNTRVSSDIRPARPVSRQITNAPQPVKAHQAASVATTKHATPQHKATAHQQAIAQHLDSKTRNQQIKNHQVSEKIAQGSHAKAKAKKAAAKKIRISLKPRFASIVTASLALLLLGGYLTYINLPNLSVRVAAARAGIDASYPEYRPDGYSLNGPIAYSAGEVKMNFTANSNQQLSYAVQQKASSWDSQAVLDNYITKKSSNYMTYSERGLTIYTYDNNAAWVNGGIFYTINGNAPLSNDQILHIASSM